MSCHSRYCSSSSCLCRAVCTANLYEQVEKLNRILLYPKIFSKKKKGSLSSSSVLEEEEGEVLVSSFLEAAKKTTTTTTPVQVCWKCLLKQCTCHRFEGGHAANGTNCPTMGDMKCDFCHKGYRKTAKDECFAICKCKYGIPWDDTGIDAKGPTQTKCGKPNLLRCQICNSDKFRWLGKGAQTDPDPTKDMRCQALCTCRNGTPVKVGTQGCPRAACAKCTLGPLIGNVWV